MPFSGPSVGPQTSAEQEEYDRLTTDMREGVYSCCIGWVIRQAKLLEDDRELWEMKHTLGGQFDGFPRLTQGRSLALLFTKKVG